MRWIKAGLALMAIVALAVVPPLLLWACVGSPWPSDVSWNAQLTNGALIKLLSVVVWLLWAQTMWCVVVEVTAAFHSTSLERNPGVWPVQQHLARVLVGAIVTAVIAVPSFPVAAAADFSLPADPAPLAPNGVATSTTCADTDRDAGIKRLDEPTSESAALVSVTVSRGDSLWALAERHLADGNRWAEIAAANEGRTMRDGRTFHAAEVLRPGWDLLVPAPLGRGGRDADPDETDYIVKPGDSLSQIALDKLDDANAWPELFEASKQLEQPVPLTDPDRIVPGQRINVPDDVTRPREVESERDLPRQDRTSHHDSPRSVEGEGIAPKLEAPRPIAESSAIERDDDAVQDAQLPGWVMPGLAGAGTLLAASLLLALRRRRANQRRSRRPGRTFLPVGPEFAKAEKSIVVAGGVAVNTVELIQDTLCRLANSVADLGQAMPKLAAVEVTAKAIALHLREAAQPPAPWVVSDDGLVWVVDREVEPNSLGRQVAGQPAPWPMLATIGHDDADNVWLLNLEDLDIAVSGNPVTADEFVRFIAAEIACNPWSKHTTLDLIGIAAEVERMNPDRIYVHENLDLPAAEMVAEAVRTIDRLSAYDSDTTTARARQVDPDIWPSRVVIISREQSAGKDLAQLSGLIADHPGQTAAAVIRCGAGHPDQFSILIDEQRQLTVPAVNLSLRAVGLTSSEAKGCAALLAQADKAHDAPVPDFDNDEGWRAMSTVTGALRDEHRLPRNRLTAEPSTALLDDDDNQYLTVAATTADDLQALAPKVPAQVREQRDAFDPTLDADLEAWLSDQCARPRLTLLGPVGARTSGIPLTRRKPYYTELFAFLATRPHGATNDEVATAFDITPGRVRTDINKLREWLGVNPDTGEQFVPHALGTSAAAARGIGVYEVVGPLVDIDLFRRLRLRGESRGSAGLGDLATALRLVQGRPFDKLRPAGWGWLFENDRIDQHMTCAIVDVAHILVAHGLRTGDLSAARKVVETALAAAPDEEIALLDLAAVLEAEGHHDRAERVVRDKVCNRSDDGDAPVELVERTEQIVDAREWLNRQAM